MYRQIKVNKGRDKSLRNMHPWLFSGALHDLPDYENGEIVEVVTSENKVAGYGFFSPRSQIVCRIFEFTPEIIDSFGLEYFREKIRHAENLRRVLIKGDTDCYRLINAEGDFFPGLIADVYGKTVVLQVLVKGTERLLDIVAGILSECGYRNIYVRNPGVKETESVGVPSGFIRGGGKTLLEVRENSLKFMVDIERGQKTGFFLDQRDNRELVKNFSAGRKVLNSFCYTGAFSVYALTGGADLVQSVDISADAVTLVTENIKINLCDSSRHQSIKADCFDYLRSMEDNFYDMIILDPPAFVKSAGTVEKGARGYKDINLCAMKKAGKSSLIFTFSCSHHISPDLFRKIVFSAAADSGRKVRILGRLSQGMDHPFSIYHPEGEYLKGLILHVE